MPCSFLLLGWEQRTAEVFYILNGNRLPDRGNWKNDHWSLFSSSDVDKWQWLGWETCRCAFRVFLSHIFCLSSSPPPLPLYLLCFPFSRSFYKWESFSRIGVNRQIGTKKRCIFNFFTFKKFKFYIINSFQFKKMNFIFFTLKKFKFCSINSFQLSSCFFLVAPALLAILGEQIFGLAFGKNRELS